jgi:tetratricopeptide (TPR) repeat protein
LEQAAAYLEATSTPPSEYLDLLRDRAGELFALSGVANSQQTIATIWTLSLRRAAEESSAAEDLLSLCAFLGPDGIPRSLLTDHPDVLPKPLAIAVRDWLAFQQALGALRRYSLVAVSDQTVSMHRLVQRVTRDALTTNEQHNGAMVALRLVLAGFPEDTEDAEHWPLAAGLLAHALTVISHPAAYVTDPEATANLLNRVGEYLWARADYRQAKEVYLRALSLAEVHFGSDHLITAQCVHNLAHALQSQDELHRARTLFERAMAIFEAQLGMAHPRTVHILGNLGELLINLVLGSLDPVGEGVASVAWGRRRAAPHPRAGTGVEPTGRHPGGQGDLLRGGEALPGKRLAAKQPPPALLEVEPAGAFGDEGVLDAGMIQ